MRFGFPDRRVLGAVIASAIASGSVLAGGQALLAERGAEPVASAYFEPKIERSSAAGGGTVPTSVTPRARYKTLLRKIDVPRDQQTYGDFYDYGYYTGTSYMEHTDLPVGYWVYVAPHWLIYKEDLNSPAIQPPRSWSAEQATGAPDTPNAGDVPTAWASASPDGQREWLELTYDAQVEAVGVMVYETYNPGAVDSVVAYAGNEQVQVWAGKDPTEPGKPMGVSVIGFGTAVKTDRVRINIDSPRVAGWNEIDAVGLIDKAGKVHWAVRATASSVYGTALQPVADQGLPRIYASPTQTPDDARSAPPVERR